MVAMVPAESATLNGKQAISRPGLTLRPDVPVERHGLILSSLQSSDSDVSRCAIAAWASRT